MPPKEPEGIGDILSKLVKKPTLSKAMLQARIWEEWEQLAGPVLSLHGKPHKIKDGMLTIFVDSPVWMNKFAYRKWEIIQRINRLSRRELVSDLFLELAPDEDPTVVPKKRNSPKH